MRAHMHFCIRAEEIVCEQNMCSGFDSKNFTITVSPCKLRNGGRLGHTSD